MTSLAIEFLRLQHPAQNDSGRPIAAAEIKSTDDSRSYLKKPVGFKPALGGIHGTPAC